MSDSRVSLLPIVKRFYQQSLDLGKASHSPLMADGIDVKTLKPAKWIYPDGVEVPMSNFASQQNLMRGYLALSMLTGNNLYLHEAQNITEYFLENYADKASGLLQWGGHRFVNLETGDIEGPASKECVHELKHHFPFYDLLFQMQPEVTESFLKGFWAAHVTDWEKLDLTRHGEYGKEFPADLFKIHQPKEVVDPAKWPELPETVGLTFVNASTDLIYAACHYYRYTGDADALKWAKHLYRQFVAARHPETRMPVYQFSSPKQREPIPEDDRLTYSWFGDRAKRQFGPEFGDIAREANVLFRDCWAVVVDNPLAMLSCVQNINDEEWLNWVIEGIVGYFSHAWDEQSNEVLPMWTDGTDLTGYTFKRHGYYGEKGTTLARRPADPAYLLTLVRAARASSNQQVKALTAKMFERFNLGSLDAETLVPVEVAERSHLASTYLLFALLELHQHSEDKRLLVLADSVAQNLLKKHYHENSGLFVEDLTQQYARLDDPIAYALLALEAAYAGVYDDIPQMISTGGYLHGDRNINGEIKVVYDRDVIYGQPHNEMAMVAR